MKGETAIGTDSEMPVGQHGACGNPMVMVGKSTVFKAWHPDQISSMEAREQSFDPEGVAIEVEQWRCPDGCTKRNREL